MRKWLAILIIGVTSLLSAEEHKIQIMMTVPRTVSTAFEKSMMARGDHKVFHEPWNSEYLYRNGFLDKTPPQEIADAGSYEGVKALIYRYAVHSHVYVKDMFWAASTEMINDQAFLADPNVVLTILIRDPALSIESFFLKMGERTPLDKTLLYAEWLYCYDLLVRLAEKYREIRGEWPMIVEAEDLCADPQTVIQGYCRYAGIPYMPEALNWEKGAPDEWKHLARWHTDAAESQGFFVPKRVAKNRFSAVPDMYVPALEAIYEKQKPFYEQLKAMKQEKSPDR